MYVKSACTVMCVVCVQARVLRLLLPGSGLKGALLTKATATDNTFSKVRPSWRVSGSSVYAVYIAL